MAEKFNAGKMTVKGRVATEPTEHETPNGTIAAFRLADNKRYLDRESGEWKNGETIYYDVGVSKDQLRANVLASLQKGQLVNVEGNHQITSYPTKDGEAGLGHRIYATDVSPSLQLDSLSRQPSAPTSTEPEASTQAEAQVQQTPAQPQGPGTDQQRLAQAQTQPTFQTPQARQQYEQAQASWAALEAQQAQTHPSPAQQQSAPGLS